MSHPRLPIRLRPACWSLVLAVIACAFARVSAETILTNCSEAALEAALGSGGRIVLACNGTITHGSTKVIAKDTVLETSAGGVTLSGGGTNRLFNINPGVTLTLRGLTLAHGSHQGEIGRDGGELEDGKNGSPAFGGAIFNDGGTLIATQVTFATNTVAGGNGGLGANGQFLGANGRDGGRGGAAKGGAILNRLGTLLLTNCTFVSNNAVGGGGGAAGDGLNATLSGNGGDGGDGGHGQGGAVHTEGNGLLVLVDCTFTDNQAEGGTPGEPGLAGGGITFDGSLGGAGNGEGGALFGNSASVVGIRSTLDHNTVRGADALDGLDGFNSRAGMDGDSGGDGRGGALAIVDGTATFTNCTFFANTATGGAGGAGGDGGNVGFGGDGGDGGRGGRARGASIFHGAASAGTFVHCTFSSSVVTGGSGGAGGAAGASTANRGGSGSTGLAEGANIAVDSRAVELYFTLLADGEGGPNASGPVNDGGFNLSSDHSPAFGHPDSLNETDPLLAALADNGGLTHTLALSPNSPARDFGSDVRLVDTDQRNLHRLNPSDAGAFEYDGVAGLAIVADGDLVTLSWPVSVLPLQLESTGSLLVPDWQPVTGAIRTGSMFIATNAAAGATRFYRLTE